MRGLDRGLSDVHALGPERACDLDDEDGVLAGQRDQKDDADLGVDVVVEVAHGDGDDDADQSHRHDQDHRERVGPAFVLGGEEEKDDEDRHREDNGRLPADLLLLVGHARPGIAHAGRKRPLSKLLHDRQRLARAEAGRRLAVDRRGRKQVVEADQGRARGVVDGGHGAERHHLPVAVADVELADAVRLLPERRVGLDEDLEGPAELVELVDEGRAHVGLDGGEHVADGHAQVLGAHPVDVGETAAERWRGTTW